MSRRHDGRTDKPGGARVHDFDLHGVVGIRLLDATEHDVAKVRRQLGPIEVPLEREPDIVVRFVDALEPASLTLVGVGDSGFDRDSFVVLRGRAGMPGRARIPFDRITDGIELTCERRLPAVPHLVAVINLTALAKGVLPLHATAFTLGATGVLVTGWSKGGKTEALLGSMARGAEYVGDEWVYLTGDGRMLGLPEPIRIWAWQFDQLRDLLRARPAAARRRLKAWRGLADVMAPVARSGLPGTSLVRRVQPVLERQAYLQVAPTDLFGKERVSLSGRLDAVVLVMSHERPETVSRPVTPGEIAHRMQASLEEERAPLMTHYRQFRYAFPDRSSPVIENAGELEAKLLAARLNDCPCATVVHPYPCDIDLLGSTVSEAVHTALVDAGKAGARPIEPPSVPS